MIESEEEFDELPPISVDYLTHDTSNVSETDMFVMPAADVLASQRERELYCEQELRTLNAPRSESSESEGEAALAAAVMGLRVLPSPVCHRLTVSALFHAILPFLPPADFLQEYVSSCRQPDWATFTAFTADMLSNVCALLTCETNVWGDEEVVAVGAWLCILCIAEETRRVRTAAARALRVLLDERSTAAQVAALCSVVARVPAAALLPLADAVGGTAQGLLASTLCSAALANALSLQEDQFSLNTYGHLNEILSKKWSTLEADKRFAVVQILGRRLAADSLDPDDNNIQRAAERTQLLRILGQTIPASYRHHPEYLKADQENIRSVSFSRACSIFANAVLPPLNISDKTNLNKLF